MLSVDTNVIVRFLVNDEPEQYARARALLSSHDVWMGVTVVLETEWVLRSVYRFRPADFVDAIASLAGLPRLEIEEIRTVERALSRHAAGMDFADALHGALSERCEAFVTFDKACLELSEQVGLIARAP